jgi:hypothetical protein
MKRTVSVASILLIMVTCWAGGALAYTFTDTTDVQEWRYSGPFGSGVWKDVIGDANTFNTFGADLNSGTFTIYTNWNPGKDGYLGVTTADLFIYKGSNTSPDFAIRLDTTTGTGNVYANPSYKTSKDLLSSTGLVYGGQYDQASPQLTPTQATSAATGSTSVVWTYGSSNLNNQVDINLTGLGLGGPWKFVWGTATCSNDALSSVVPTPIPGTLVLLGSALISLAGAGLRQKKLV